MDIFTFASTMGLSVPLTVLGLSLLHQFGAGPASAEAMIGRYPALASPTVFVLALALLLFEFLASKSKLTKPIKHLYDFLVTFVKPLLLLMFTLATTQGSPSVALDHSLRFHEAGIGLGWIADALSSLSAMDLFRLGIAIAVLMLVHGIRAVIDIVAWLTPIPFIDAAVSAVLDVYAVGMLLLVVFFPVAAMVACAAQLLACLLLAGWSFRILAALIPLALGRFGRPRPLGESVPGWVAERAPRPAVTAWVERCPPFARFARVHLSIAGSGLHVFGSRRFRRRHERVVFPEGAWVGIREGFLYDTVAISIGAKILFEVALPRTASEERSRLVAQLATLGCAVHDHAGNDMRLPLALRARVSP